MPERPGTVRRNKRCEEIVTGNGKKYLLSGTIGNIEALALAGNEPSVLFAKLSEGFMPPRAIRDTIRHTLMSVDGVSIDDLDADEEADYFVESYGLQDSSLLARTLIYHAIIGTVKKKQIQRGEILAGMVRKLPPFLSTISARPGLLWAALLMVLLALACTIFKLP